MGTFLIKEAGVMTHHDLALERSYGLKCDADNDQDRCAADADTLKRGYAERQNDREYSDDSEEYRAAYGMILISMAIHTAQRVKALGGGVIRWLSFGYIVAFSMSIPVVYHTSIELSALFIPLEIIVSAGMVVMFTVMLRGFYEGDGEYQFPAAPFCAAVVGDAAVLMLRWNEEINFFVLIFICVTAMLFIAGKIAGSART